ncbi:hypothetical protein DL769_010695 [Monosporascus sp. CRB-8-3]|nr:hypothetical protein DL769_010695 [Monosporascus sp. CRB-8-3]
MGASPSIPRDRSRQLQVIGAGYGRTGTSAISMALEKLLDGPVMHGGTQILAREDAYLKKLVDLQRSRGDRPRMMRLLREITAGFVGITDQPGILYIPELMELYPDVKVVLVTRDPEKWWKSIEPVAKNVQFWWLKPLLFPVPALRWVPEIFQGFIARNRSLYGDMKPGIGRSHYRLSQQTTFPQNPRNRERQLTVGGGTELLKRHNAHIRKVVPKERLLEMEVQDGWEPLCKFLGKPIPDEPFPRSNEAAAVQQRFKEAVITAFIIWVSIISFTSMGIYVLYSLYILSFQQQQEEARVEILA